MSAPFVTPGRARVRSPIAPMYAEPHVTSIQVSQRLCGHDVELLEEHDDWYLARGVDAYEGWIHRGFLASAPAASARGSQHVSRISLGCVTNLPGGGQRALPLGARLSPAESVREGEVIDEPELEIRFPAAALPITRTAQTYFEGASYLWGGVTPWGADCSGFVQSVFGLHGVALPRDAWQQSGSGMDAGPLEHLQPADLAFFSDRVDKHVTHVAISLGRARLVHVALGRGGFAVENLTATADPYVRKLHERFLRARRVL